MNTIKKVTFDRKKDAYKYMNIKLLGLITSESDPMSNLCNSAGLLGHLMDDINWVGFYFVKGDELKLGPFIGKPACTTLDIGRGVCGTSVRDKETKLIKNVNHFEGHVACDPESKSEIVLPIQVEGEIIAVLDVDSPSYNRFDEEDKIGLTRIVDTIRTFVDWDSMQQ